MKISFPSSLDALLTKKQGALYIISSIIVGFLAGFGGSYLLANNSRSLTIIVLGLAGILLCLGGAVSALVTRSNFDEARRAPRKKNVPQITSAWDYRPRQAIRRYAATDIARAETSDALSPTPFAINNA